MESQQRREEVVVPRSGLAQAPVVPSWARYVLGALWLLADRGVDVPPLRIRVDSDVPVGAGLSSSAALVCSTLCAVQDHLALGLERDDLLALSRAVENRVVGVPTGGMDQMVSLRGVAGHALCCDMREVTADAVPFDPESVGLGLLVIDTRAPHRLVDGEYAARRRACERAAAVLGVPALRDVGASDLPSAVSRVGDETLARHVRHVVTENDRVLTAAALLRAGRVADVGPLLTESHASMRDDFRITVPEVDTAVETLLASGALGARMTGGGFGGCVIGLVGEQDVGGALEAVERAFAAARFAAPHGFTATPSAGARPI